MLKERTCNICNKHHINRSTMCKKCISNKNIAYSRTIQGLATKMLAQQTRKSKKRGHVPPAYTNKELLTWLTSQDNITSLMSNWELSNYNPDLTPSCDRKNDYKPYTFDNIQLMTWGENNQKARNDRRNGINNKISTPIHQYTKQGEFIDTFVSYAAASRELSINSDMIRHVAAKYKSHQAGGFFFSHNKPLTEEDKEWCTAKRQSKHIIHVLNKNKDVYTTRRAAAIALGVSMSSFYRLPIGSIVEVNDTQLIIKET